PVRFEETDADELVGPFGENAEGAGETDAGGGVPQDTLQDTLQGVPDGTPASVPAGTAFTGFSVPAHRTFTVKLRLSLTSDAVADDITARAAVVQKRGDDGEWVGQSNAYRFAVLAAPGAIASPSPHEAGSPVAGAHELAGTGLRSAVAGVTAVAGCLVGVGVALMVVRRKYYG
ncbi:MAG TPA: hypothetical protein VIU15_26510, partial [Streptomyces sp.]